MFTSILLGLGVASLLWIPEPDKNLENKRKKREGKGGQHLTDPSIFFPSFLFSYLFLDHGTQGIVSMFWFGELLRRRISELCVISSGA